MSDVSLKGVRKDFDGHAVIKGVDLEVAKGEFLVMVGPSGCGKTTLLRLIAGLETADAGAIAIGGRVVGDVPPRDRDVAMVFQSYALYPHMSVRENLAFGLKLRKFPETEIAVRVAEAAGLLELTPLLERRPKALSGGQRQRVAMGRAIVRHPKVFLFDEPLSNLDTALRVQMRGELARLHRRLGATMIYVTHDQVEAMTLATRVAVFNQGILQQVGAPLELYHRPANRFVAGFLGSPAMNFLSARRESGNLVGKGFSFPAPADLPDSGSEVQIGLRPQELIVGAKGVISGEVEAIERMGFDGYAYLSTQAGPIAARFGKGNEVAVGDKVGVSPTADALHVFNADGRALRHPASESL
jgi:multiple sugar transport system ATP-binding protein